MSTFDVLQATHVHHPVRHADLKAGSTFEQRIHVFQAGMMETEAGPPCSWQLQSKVGSLG